MRTFESGDQNNLTVATQAAYNRVLLTATLLVINL